MHSYLILKLKSLNSISGHVAVFTLQLVELSPKIIFLREEHISNSVRMKVNLLVAWFTSLQFETDVEGNALKMVQRKARMNVVILTSFECLISQREDIGTVVVIPQHFSQGLS